MKLVLAKQDMQAYGSAVSYARRYGLQSMVFIGAEDDDGEATMSRPKSAKEQSFAAQKATAPKAAPSVAAASPATPAVNLVASTPVANGNTVTKPGSFKVPAAPKAEAAPAKPATSTLDW